MAVTGHTSSSGQVAQHVPKLWNYLDVATKDAAGQSFAGERNKLGAKLFGAGPAAPPVTLSPDTDDPKLAEENGSSTRPQTRTALAARSAAHPPGKPRDTLGDDPAEALKLTKRHRLIRRGRSFGPRAVNPLDTSDTQDRGLMFMCVNANLERQFEFVQQTWVNNPSFNGLYNERDPIFGNSGAQTTGSMTIPRQPVRGCCMDWAGS